jgi:hypothetical protein
MQMNFALEENRVMSVIKEKSPSYFGTTLAMQNITHIRNDCHTVMQQCVHSALNPFPVGVNVTMQYGHYLEVSPDALTSFYTHSFFGKMARCTFSNKCSAAAPRDLQVSPFHIPNI